MDSTPDDLATRLGRLALDLGREREVSDALRRVVEAAVELVDGAEEGTVRLVIDLDRTDVTVETVLPPERAASPHESVLSLPLLVGDDDLGSLTLYARAPGAFDEGSVRVGRLVAAHAAVAVAGRRRQEQLANALATRDLIGQASGILMERFRITGAEAFRLLVGASQRRNRKLRDVASDLVTSGEWTGAKP